MKNKKIIRIISILLLSALLYGLYVLNNMLPVATGFAAKNMCSGLFVAGRDSASLKDVDLGFFPVKFTSENIDREHKKVTSTLLGMFSQAAIYREGLGCTLLSGISEDELKNSVQYTSPQFPFDVDTMLWPVGNIIETDTSTPPRQLAEGWEGLQNAIDNSFAEKVPGHLLNTRAVIVVYNGKLIGEKYADGFDKNSRFIGWSMTKSLTNAWLGSLLKRNITSLAVQPVFKDWANDERKNITLTNLLQMSSGLEWEENYNKLSSATQMLYKEKEMGRYAASFPLEKTPDTEWNYSSGTTNIISLFIKNLFPSENDYLGDAYENLFYKIGMHSLQMETDAGNTYVGSSYSYATARDWAKFGLFCLNDGKVNGESLLPDGWMKFSSAPAPTATCGVYGAHFWRNNSKCNSDDVTVFPNCPDDMYSCDGFMGQYVVIIPSKNLVIVRLGYCHNYAPHLDTLVSGVIKALY